MFIIRFIKKAYAVVNDPNRDFTERVFLIFTFISELAIAAAFVGDLLIGENIYELITIGATLVVVPVIVMVCLHFDQLKIAIRLIVIGIVFIVLPLIFFFGGGLEGGAYLWFIFAFMYVGLVLRNRWRRIMFVVITLMASGCYFTAFIHPEYVSNHTQEIYYIDSFISLILVGVLCYIMTRSQGRLFRQENERAKKAAEKAEQLTISQNRFFSSMSHEIRTPINSILGLNELILRDQNATEEIVKDAIGIQGSGKMLLALINDILDFSKIEAGSMDIVPVDYRIGDMLSEIVNMMWLKAHDKGLEFEISVDPTVPKVLYGDEIRIKQIIINLLNNAVKYTAEGSVELHIESKEKDKDKVELIISVTDTGVGIKKEDIPYLFDAFKRVDEGKNRHIEGSGLGLSIVKQLVEMMGGTASVNSVYGEGSTFTVTVEQVVSVRDAIGELNIHNQHLRIRNRHESSFLAPEAKILIVDDNEMNLEVESRLLKGSDMGIDLALSGKEALELCQKVHYDAILMDHLMPGMDGLECLEFLRNQPGGLNRNTPVIVLTANAGSENRELYNQAGFDGYLVKPVSGEALEEMLIKHISSEKIIVRNIMMSGGESIRTSDKFSEKVPVIITSTSLCDLPDSVIKKLHIPLIPVLIKTEDGIFKDGVHIDAYELIKHMLAGKKAETHACSEAEYTEFFAEALKKAHHLIHISIASNMSDDYRVACEAAKSFDNVTVVNSEVLSSSTGLLVLIAYKLVQQGLSAEEIYNQLENVKARLRCSFVMESTDFISKKGYVSRRLHKFATAVNLRPALSIKNNKVGIAGLWLGSPKTAYKSYIRRALPPDLIPDPEVVFITYVDLPTETLMWIKEEIQKVAYFEHVVFQQASAAISANSGPGTFGILYFLKANKTYNISSYIDDYAIIRDMLEEETGEEQSDDIAVRELSDNNLDGTVNKEAEVKEEEVHNTSSETDKYNSLTYIDVDTAIQNSGSESSFKAVLKIFYDSLEDKCLELERYYTGKDWENYTIKVHALKSSARLVGATDLSKKAQDLETAGNAANIDYINSNHRNVMAEFLAFRNELTSFYEGDNAKSVIESERPVADEFIMESAYEGLKDAAGQMNYDMIEDIFAEIEEYEIPGSEAEKFNKIKEKAENLDYDGLLEVLNS